MRKRTVLLTIALMTGGVLSGCGGSSGNDKAEIKVIHASPDAPNVDVLIDGGRVIGDVPYQAASEFLEIDPGSRRLQINVAGTDTTAIDATAPFAEDQSYTAFAIGRVAEIRALIVDTDRTAPPSGSAKVRVLHAAPSAPTVDVYVSAAGANPFETAPTLSGVPFSVISDYLTIPAGTYDLTVTPAGQQTTAIEAKGVAIASGTIGTVAALDAVGGGTPFSLRVYLEN